MIVRISPTHPFRLSFDTLVVEGGGNSEIAGVAEAVADAVADAVEEVAEAVADAVSDSGSEEPSAEWVERIVRLELAVEALGLVVAGLEGAAQSAENTAGLALHVAEGATTPDDVEAMIEETVIKDTDGDGDADVIDAPDEPPANTGRSLMFASGAELRDRLFKRSER